MARHAARTVLVALALLALAVGCTADPGVRPTASAPVPKAPATVPPEAATAWRPLAPLSGEQLRAALAPVAELPPGTTTEDEAPPSDATVATIARAAQRKPACAPVLDAMIEQSADSARLTYVTGDNNLGNRTSVQLAGVPGGRARADFEALRDAVHGGGCTSLRLNDRSGAEPLEVEPVAFQALEVPVVGFRLLSPTGAMAGRGGFTRLYLYAAVGDNRAVFYKGDDTALAPALPTGLVTAQIHRLVTAGASPEPTPMAVTP
ncbi:hypothetical protein ACFXPX_25425 [Kitasatospora sp. NPDC059146]|uniref:hypothetical protein n=1 Tax=Kitasatospora sp. NPDC059146 TaxID=3346741 RepID=UPI0036874D89